MSDRQVLHGGESLKQALRELPDKLRRRALRNALAAGGRIVKEAAISSAPFARRRYPNRTAGLIRQSIYLRTSKRDRKAGNVGVFVNVRPAKGGERGAKSKRDPFYWRWLEFGREAGTTRRRSAIPGAKPSLVRVGAMAPSRFLQASADKMPAALAAFERVIGPQIQKMNSRRAGQ